MLQALDKWHKTRLGHLVFGFVELTLAYVFGSWAIDTGSLLDYFCAIVLLVGGVRNFGKFVALLLKGKVRHATK